MAMMPLKLIDATADCAHKFYTLVSEQGNCSVPPARLSTPDVQPVAAASVQQFQLPR